MFDPRTRLGIIACLMLMGAGTVAAQGQGTPLPTIPPLVPPTPSFNGPTVRERGAPDPQKIGSGDGAATKSSKPTPAAKADDAEKAPPALPDENAAPKGDPAVDAKVARSDAETRLKALPTASDKDKEKAAVSLTAHQKALRDVLTERLKWLDAFELATKELDDAKNPKPNPEQEAVERKNEFERAKAVLDGSASDPHKLLPERFHDQTAKIGGAGLVDLREAIEAVSAELKERSEDVEKLRAKPGRSVSSTVTVIRTERDKTAQRVAALPARRAEREKALNDSTTVEGRELARERMIAFEWESRAESLRIKAAEAQIRVEIKRSDLSAITLQARELQARIAKLTLDQLQAKYRDLSDSQQNNLRIAAATEASRATSSEDALERFKAQRRAEILELEAALTSDEKAYAASPRISLQEQSRLADRAATEFADLKALLKDDKVSSLDALQLNNDFRRVTRERSLIQRNELADAAAVLAHYENQLTELELELLSDARDDRFELENLLAILPAQRHDEARKLIDSLDVEHRSLLVKRRTILEKLAGRAKATHNQVLRRIDILDEQYALVRTNLFWIRDANPIGIDTLSQAKRELKHLLPGVGKFLSEPMKRSLWGQPSIPFGMSMVAVVIMPFIVLYARKAFRQLA